MRSCVTVLALMFVMLTGHSQSLNDSLLLHYPLDGNAIDISGNNFHGTISGAMPDTNWFGTPNAAMRFNGSSSFIDFPNDPALKPPLPVSAAFWVKFDTLLPSKVYVFTSDYAQNRYTGIWFSLMQNSWEMNIHYGDGTFNQTTSHDRRTKRGTTVFQAGIWYYVVGVIRGPNDMDIYVNCRNDEGTYSGTGGSLAYSSMPGSIGRLDMATIPPYYFQGSLSDFRYWNRALTQDDVNALCTGTSIISPVKPTVQIYPNPTKETIRLTGDNLDPSGQYEIFNAVGQKVQAGNILQDNHFSIDVSTLRPGVYILTCQTAAGIPVTAKFIKQ